jgi:diadenosine tetraphosphatase ApaH/serine/threonine PP2A family protein phosphatase
VRYLVLSDIHANLEALEAVLASDESWEAVLFMGDLVGYGPSPDECTALLRAQPNLTSVLGNHDVAALGQINLDEFNPQAKFAALWTQRTMSPETKQYLESLGQVEELDRLTVVHGSPRDPVWEYLDQPDQAPENFARFTTPICFVGHTHVPRVFSQDPETRETAVHVPQPDAAFRTADGIRRIINPGSVGQPRDGDPRASFGFHDSESGLFEYRRVPYDVDATQERMKAAGLPKPLADRLAFGF